MVVDLQKANIWKRIAAWMFDGILICVLAVGCGALLCKAAMESAAMNVFVNTGSLRDRATAARLEQQVDAALATYLPMADRIAAAVTATIRKES